MRIGHVSLAGRNKSGLCESVYSLVSAERSLGVDAEIVLPPNEQCDDDRDVPVVPFERINDYDVIVSHSGVKLSMLQGQPVVYVCHANPHYVFLLDGQRRTTNFYSMCWMAAWNKQYKAFVTFYPEHLPYWRVMLPPDRLHVINPPLNMAQWCDGPSDYDFGGKGGAINIVCSTTWRECHTMFHILHAAVEFGRHHPGTKVHIYGIGRFYDDMSVSWQTLLERLRLFGILGEVAQWTGRMRDIYRVADMSIVPVDNATNTVRQSLACGCPVVADAGNKHTQWTARQEDVDGFAEQMGRCWEAMQADRGGTRNKCVTYARHAFDPKRAAQGLLKIVEDVYEPVT